MGAVFSWVNALEGAGVSLSASSEAPGLGVQSVLSTTIADVWRSDLGGSATHRIGANLGAAKPLRVFAAAMPRDGVLPGPGATWRVRVSNVAIGQSEVLNSGVLPADGGRGTLAFLAPATVSGRYVQFSFYGAASDPYLQLGRVWAGEALVTQRNPSYGWQRGVLDTGSSERAAISGVRSVQRGAVARTLAFDLLLTGAEADALDRIALAAGTSGQILAAPFDNMGRAMFGRLAAPLAPSQTSKPAFTTKVSLEEDF
ncbi:hypothetical protein [Roseomonas chloroacetimidivorans]|uniref:hypothetical protein n=1 Tax=Roseomonas chloroacetimidivorans TaxID=1766656 RepID=UPI003C73BB8B